MMSQANGGQTNHQIVQNLSLMMKKTPVVDFVVFLFLVVWALSAYCSLVRTPDYVRRWLDKFLQLIKELIQFLPKLGTIFAQLLAILYIVYSLYGGDYVTKLFGTDKFSWWHHLLAILVGSATLLFFDFDENIRNKLLWYIILATGIFLIVGLTYKRHFFWLSGVGIGYILLGSFLLVLSSPPFVLINGNKRDKDEEHYFWGGLSAIIVGLIMLLVGVILGIIRYFF
jgi:hypothetical protein